MEEVNSRFRGIELAVIYPEKKQASFVSNMRNGFVNLLLGNRTGFTVIGPASIVKEIKKDPNKIELFTKDKRKR